MSLNLTKGGTNSGCHRCCAFQVSPMWCASRERSCHLAEDWHCSLPEKLVALLHDLPISALTLLSVVSPADSPCVRRMILEYGYNPLAAVTRSRNAAWNVPKARLIEFGLVFAV